MIKVTLNILFASGEPNQEVLVDADTLMVRRDENSCILILENEHQSPYGTVAIFSHWLYAEKI